MAPLVEELNAIEVDPPADIVATAPAPRPRRVVDDVEYETVWSGGEGLTSVGPQARPGALLEESACRLSSRS